MESRVINLVQNSNLLGGVNKKTNPQKPTGFNDTLKSHGKNYKNHNQFQINYEKAIRNKENTSIDNKDKIEIKKQIESVKHKTVDGEDIEFNYKNKYNMILNLFQNISRLDNEPESENKESRVLGEDDIKILDSETLIQINLDEIDKLAPKEMDILDTGSELKLNEDTNKTIPIDVEVLDKNLNFKLTADENKLNKNQNKINKSISNIFKTNEDLNVNKDKKEILSDDNSKLLIIDESYGEGDKEDFKKDSKPETFKLEQLKEDLNTNTKEDLNVNNKTNFTFETQERKLPLANDVEFKEHETIDKKQFMDHIVERAKFDLGNNKNQIKVTLKPKSLGEMIMEVEVVKNNLVAKIMVDNFRAKEIIENNLFQLKEGIEDTGLEIKTFEVFVGNNSDFNKHNSNQFNFNGRNKKLKVKGEKLDKKLEFYEDNTKIQETKPINIYSGTNLNLFA